MDNFWVLYVAQMLSITPLTQTMNSETYIIAVEEKEEKM